MTEYILDANGLLRYLRNDIPAQADAVEALFRSTREGTSRITLYPMVLLEVQFVLWKLYKHNKNDIAKQLLQIIDNPTVDVRERSAVRSSLVVWSESAISFVDAYLLFQSKQEKKVLFTFDKKLKRLAEKV